VNTNARTVLAMAAFMAVMAVVAEKISPERILKKNQRKSDGNIMDTKMLFSAMPYKMIRKKKVETIPPGKRSELSRLKADLFKMKPGEQIIVPPDAYGQRSLYRRLRTNIQHWKKRNGLKHISVRLTQDGNVLLAVSAPVKKKEGWPSGLRRRS
jgi:hypothetical protein